MPKLHCEEKPLDFLSLYLGERLLNPCMFTFSKRKLHYVDKETFYLISFLIIHSFVMGLKTSFLCCRHGNLMGLQSAKQLAENLIQTVSERILTCIYMYLYD